MNFFDMNFKREAVLCFYRSLEYFVASKILAVKHLSNEVRQIQEALKRIAASDQEMLDEFKAIYKVRSSQVAHSQGVQREITIDEVFKLKVFLDFLMHKSYIAEADLQMRARFGQP
jgi:hypothetical protein